MWRPPQPEERLDAPCMCMCMRLAHAARPCVSQGDSSTCTMYDGHGLPPSNFDFIQREGEGLIIHSVVTEEYLAQVRPVSRAVSDEDTEGRGVDDVSPPHLHQRARVSPSRSPPPPVALPLQEAQRDPAKAKKMRALRDEAVANFRAIHAAAVAAKELQATTDPSLARAVGTTSGCTVDCLNFDLAWRHGVCVELGVARCGSCTCGMDLSVSVSHPAPRKIALAGLDWPIWAGAAG
jgi:hypothetical protein